jgi:flagellar biosynthesis protein FlhA
LNQARLPQMVIPFGILLIVMVMIVPLPTMLIDLLIASNITIAILVLLTAMLVAEPLEFSVFPALLLVTTMFRLALAVSTTRLILSHGEGGKVIEAFGGFVVSGNLVIGLVVFLILVVIQFAVVTSGAGRVAEVGARFTLDAMPGKQMAIDADLNAGLITDSEARRRRVHVAREADFYGSMDGASKFVKGDAMAGVVIVLVNLFGGMAIGVLQHGLSVTESVSRYSLLSVGDGLVSQIPALLISVASGIIVTRATTDEDGGLGADLWNQLLHNRRVLVIAAASMLALAMLPGLPKLPFLALAGVLALAASRATSSPPQAEEVDDAPIVLSEDEELDREMRIEPLELELAPDLMDLADASRGGTLLDRVRALRRQIAGELGIKVPLVRTRDNLVSLPPSHYAIKLHGVEVARGEAPPGHVLVLANGDASRLPGRPTQDPVFGLPAAWVNEDLADHLQAQGNTVVDRGSVLMTHLADVVRGNADALLSRQDVQQMIDGLKRSAPAVAEEIGGAGLGVSDVHQVLRALLAERVPIRDLVRILESVTAKARDGRDPEALVEAARQTLGGVLCAQAAVDGTIAAVTFEPMLEHALITARRTGEGGWYLDLDARMTQALLSGVTGAVVRAQEQTARPTIVCAAPLRPIVRRLVATAPVRVPVLSYSELVASFSIQPTEVINVEHEAATV